MKMNNTFVEERVLSTMAQNYYVISTEYKESIDKLEEQVMKAHPKIPKGYFENHIPEGWCPDEYAKYLLDNPDTEEIKKKNLNPIWNEYYWYAVALKDGYHLESFLDDKNNPYTAINYDIHPEDYHDYFDYDIDYIENKIKIYENSYIYKCVNEGRHISRWIIRTVRDLLKNKYYRDIYWKMPEEDSKFYKKKAKKLIKKIKYWEKLKLNDIISEKSDIVSWLKFNYSGTKVKDLLNAYKYFKDNNNCCLRHQRNFPFWGGNIFNCYVDYDEYCFYNEESDTDERYYDPFC